jgi:2-polyprenyl-3-methyl-5-hydroxy-6-metoxy-1,4-benzoquinol methylase
VSAPAAKTGGYYRNERADLVAQLPRPLGRVLDVGCGEGRAGAPLRAAGAEWISGIEIEPGPAAAAAKRYDEVATGPAEAALDGLRGGPFDTVLLYDVLEHLPDPARLLRDLHGVTAPGAHAQVSVPNARHVSLLYDLVFRGTFGYTEWGHRDSTHLRWFTRRDIVVLLEGAGWRVESTSHPVLRLGRPLARLTRGRSTEFTVGQWYVLARRGP